jgi:hypothetical protein
VVVHFGDGSIYPIRRGKFHSYKRAGRYKVSVKITDRAGNVTTLTTTLKIAPKPKPKPKRKGKGKGAPKPHHSRLAK